MLKDLLNAVSYAKAQEDRKNQPDYEVRGQSEIMAKTEARNSERINEAKNIARLCCDLNARIVQTLHGVQDAIVIAHPNMQAFDGCNPNNPDESLQLGEISALATTVEFDGKTVEFKPVCYALDGHEVRCHWTITVSINGTIFSFADWSVDSYANDESTLESVTTIKIRGAMKFYEVSEYLEIVFKKAFLST